MTDIANRIQKYRKMKDRIVNYMILGLEYPVARILITKETAKEMEDEVCARIVREMRKPPAARASE